MIPPAELNPARARSHSQTMAHTVTVSVQPPLVQSKSQPIPALTGQLAYQALSPDSMVDGSLHVTPMPREGFSSPPPHVRTDSTGSNSTLNVPNCYQALNPVDMVEGMHSMPA